MILSGLVSALVLAPIQFPGGTTNDLLQTLHEATQQPVMFSPESAKRVPAFVFDPADANGMSAAFRKHADLSMVAGTQLTFFGGGLPRDIMRIPVIHRDVQKWWSAPTEPIAVQNGVVTIRTKGNEAVTVDELVKAGWSKPVVFQKFSTSYPLQIAVTNMPEEAFWTYVARVVGGRLESNAKGFRIALRPAELRNRARRTVQEVLTADVEKKTDPSQLQAIRLTMLALDMASDSQLIQVFDSDVTEVRILLSDNGKRSVYGLMQQTAQAQIQERMNAQQRGNAGGEQRMQREDRREDRQLRGPDMAMMLQLMDFRQPVTLILNSSFQTQVEGQSFARGNRPPQRLRF